MAYAFSAELPAPNLPLPQHWPRGGAGSLLLEAVKAHHVPDKVVLTDDFHS